MPLPIEEFQDDEARITFPSILILADDNMLGNVFGFFIDLEGIKGGKGIPAGDKIIYRCYMDITAFPDNNPEIWITNISDREIKHINIYHPHPCPRLGQSYPKVCTGTLDSIIDKKEKRNLFGIIISIKTILNRQNFEDPAR